MSNRLKGIFDAHPGPVHHFEFAPFVRSGLRGERIDPFAWLEDEGSPATKEFLDAENSYFNDITGDLGDITTEIFDEFKMRIKQTDLSVPVKKGPYQYYGRTEQGKQYEILCRKKVGSELEEVLLDENRLAEGHEYFAIGSSAISPDHRMLAYIVDTDGSERHTLYILDTKTMELLEDVIEDLYYGLVWSNDSKTLFYTRPDKAMRPSRVFTHNLGEDPTSDQLVIEERDDRFFLDISKTKDDAYITIDSSSKTSTESYLIDADSVNTEPVLFRPRSEGLEYYLEHHKELGFVIVTNDIREDFRIARASGIGESWQELTPIEDGSKVEAIEIFEKHLVVLYRTNGLTRLEVISADLSELRRIGTPEEVCTIYPGSNPEYDSTKFRYEYTSMVTPHSVFEIDLTNFEATLLKKTEVLGNFDPSDYVTFRTWAVSNDETLVPISVVHRVGATLPAPTLLYGYGSYEHSVDPTFSTLRLSLLDRGFVFAIAHVRGGGEMGRRWYNDGRLSKKKNTFHDFIHCARHLIDTGLTQPDGLCARGGSAGGLLMGAVATMTPELFNTVIAEVPFVDCLNTISNPEMPLTVTEWEEWGNPLESLEIYDLMASYTPYENVGGFTYPTLVVTAGLNDPRVSYFEPAKWVARIREKSPSSSVILKCDMGFGHSGPSGRYEAWEEEAGFYALMLAAVNPQPAGVKV